MKNISYDHVSFWYNGVLNSRVMVFKFDTKLNKNIVLDVIQYRDEATGNAVARMLKKKYRTELQAPRSPENTQEESVNDMSCSFNWV